MGNLWKDLIPDIRKDLIPDSITECYYVLKGWNISVPWLLWHHEIIITDRKLAVNSRNLTKLHGECIVA